jgi:membrane dipeptidase
VSAPDETDVVPFVVDLNDARRFEKLAELLLSRGHTAARVEKILGGNFLRLMREAWTPA